MGSELALSWKETDTVTHTAPSVGTQLSLHTASPLLQSPLHPRVLTHTSQNPINLSLQCKPLHPHHCPSSFPLWWQQNLIHTLQRAKCLHNPCLAPPSTPLHPDPAVSPSRQCHPLAGDSRAPGCCPLPTFLQPELAQPGCPQRGAVALLTRAVVVEVREEHLRHPDPKLIRPAKGNGCEGQRPKGE